MQKHAPFLLLRDDVNSEKMNIEIKRLEKLYQTKILMLRMPVFPVSSSEIRQELAAGNLRHGLLPECVWNYIKKEHLYEGDKKWIR